MSAEVGFCSKCRGVNKLLVPLYGPRGGPMYCVPCGSEWNAQHTRIRKWGRIVTKAIKAYLKAGGAWSSLKRLELAADGIVLHSWEADTIGSDVGDLTLELLEEIVRLTHPDRHPDRADTAAKVTAELLALKPFVFPAPKPKEAIKRNESTAVQPWKAVKPSQANTYPCELCVDQLSMDYCNACKAEHEKRWRASADLDRAKRRAYYKARRERELLIRKRRGPPKCQSCEAEISGRIDAKFCSAACRQRAHRQRVTDRNQSRRDFFLSVTAPVTDELLDMSAHLLSCNSCEASP